MKQEIREAAMDYATKFCSPQNAWNEWNNIGMAFIAGYRLAGEFPDSYGWIGAVDAQIKKLEVTEGKLTQIKTSIGNIDLKFEKGNRYEIHISRQTQMGLD